MKFNDKLYIITRRDLKPGVQAAQACHALRQFVQDWPDVDREWFETSNYVALLSVENEDELWKLSTLFDEQKIKHSKFFECNLNYSLTSIAAEPGEKTAELCANLPLMLSEFSKV